MNMVLILFSIKRKAGARVPHNALYPTMAALHIFFNAVERSTNARNQTPAMDRRLLEAGSSGLFSLDVESGAEY
jgi:hypothetical protein